MAELFPKLNLNTEDESMLLTYDTEKPKMHNSKHRSTHDMSNEKQQTRKRSLTVNTTSEDPEEEKGIKILTCIHILTILYFLLFTQMCLRRLHYQIMLVHLNPLYATIKLQTRLAR